MINILLVEDEAPKAVYIYSCLKEINSNTDIKTVKSVNSANAFLYNQLPDLMILDMSLPKFDMIVDSYQRGNSPSGLGGIEVLRFLTFEELYCPVIIITGYDYLNGENEEIISVNKIAEHFKSEFPEYIRGVIYFNSIYDDWKKHLSEIINSIGLI